MSSKKRKTRPAVPKWFWFDNDAKCIKCKTPNGCGSCKYVKRQNKYNRKNNKLPL